MLNKNDIKAYACINKNSSIRIKSTSGGMFYELASLIIDEGGEVCAAKFDDDFQVRHTFCNNKNELLDFLGSKYAPSRLDGIYLKIKEKLENGIKLMFVGTPCQVNSLSMYLNKKYENLILVDFICHGVPERKIWNKYLQCLQKKGKIKSISFRSKDTGWNDYSFKVEYSDGKELVEKRYDNAYLQGFVHDLFLREVCYHCKNRGLNRNSDITLGDFWGVEKQLPNILDDMGTSAVMINTCKGVGIFSKISYEFEVYPVRLEQITDENPSYYNNVKPHKNRQKFMRKVGRKKNIKKWINRNLRESFVIRTKNKIKNMRGGCGHFLGLSK